MALLRVVVLACHASYFLGQGPRGVSGVEEVGNKPGTCPQPGEIGICIEECGSDQDCAGIKKCCSNGCGHVCLTPLYGHRRKENFDRISGTGGYDHQYHNSNSHFKPANIFNMPDDTGGFDGMGIGKKILEHELLRLQYSHLQRGVYCTMPLATGWGNGRLKFVVHYFWDNHRKTCKPFTYKGEGGNLNNFLTMSQCENACGCRLHFNLCHTIA